jgi:hypothetical protein
MAQLYQSVIDALKITNLLQEILKLAAAVCEHTVARPAGLGKDWQQEVAQEGCSGV